MAQASLFGASWQGSLTDLAAVVDHIKRTRAFGRLSLRNLDHLTIVHLYFRAGKLVHVVGYHGDAHKILLELQEWKRASVRFDRGAATVDATLNEAHEQLLEQVLVQLSQRGVLALPQPPIPRVIDGDVISSSDAQQLIAPWEWRVLIEGTRRVSIAVAHLVGPREAFSVLQDILADCSSTFPAFASLKIASTGYLQITDRTHLDRMSREDLLERFYRPDCYLSAFLCPYYWRERCASTHH